jgi:hypothetical protein
VSFFAAPANGFPSELTALLSQVSWASAEPTPTTIINAAIKTYFKA